MRPTALLPTLRARLIAALLLVVVLAVVAETVSHMVEESRRLERELDAQSDRVVDGIRSELERTVTALDFELESASDPRGLLARSLASGRVEARFLGTKARLQTGVLEILKVLAADGSILSSGHWPASFGALDPLLDVYKATDGRALHVVDEATPQGSAPALERWAMGRVGPREVLIVAGRFLDESSLEAIRARTGADLIALCRLGESAKNARGLPRCLAVRRADLLRDRAQFDVDDAAFASRVHLQGIDLGTHALYVGLDRAGIEEVRAGILRRALAVGLASIAFAMLLGTLLATRVTRPIEQLHEQAKKLSSGDLAARVEEKRGGGEEVEGLVTAFNQMAEDIERGQTRLRQAERVAAWQEIARGLAHELKNPLTPILGAMDVIKKARRLDRPDFDAILQEQSAAVIEEVMRLKELSDAFARFARLPDRKPEPLSLPEMLDHGAALYATKENLELERVYEAGVPKVMADRTQIGTVIANLVKNAVEAMDSSGKLKLVVRRVGADAAELVVEDAGPGVSPEIRDRLFTPYVTTKGSRGTGLGLALAHRIVVEHGGTIEAGTSSLGGAAFTVRLPLAPAPASAPDADA
jgi:two-component system, NtrC family, nitrogen regulation sensor histidine kinase NtrY